MFLEKLLISSRQGIIREIPFKMGLNLIIDNTPSDVLDKLETANSIGKTTVLRLIDFCLGSKGTDIFKDTEFSTPQETDIQKFLISKEVCITLNLVDRFDQPKNRITIKRNFLKGKNKIQEIDGQSYTDLDFKEALKEPIFNTEAQKPAFRQIIAKNIRDTNERMSNIVKVLGSFGKSDEYEALYLFWFGISTDEAAEQQSINKDLAREKTFQTRLRKEGTVSILQQELKVISEKIEILENQKISYRESNDVKFSLDGLIAVRNQIHSVTEEIGRLNFRRELIFDSKVELEKEHTQIDTLQIKNLYERAKMLVPNIQVSFEETIQFHNDLLDEKIEYITSELPILEQNLAELNKQLIALKSNEKNFSIELKNSKALDSYDVIVLELNKLSEQKGAKEEQLRLWVSSIGKVSDLKKRLETITTKTLSQDEAIQEKMSAFNRYFVQISKQLYGEEYILSADQTDKGYQLNITNIGANVGTGMKKTQIAAFDLAYILFADEQGIPCLHFILHDQLETIYGNQLSTLIDIANTSNCQFVVPLLSDKLPKSVNKNDYQILELSRQDRLFRV